MPCIVHWNFNHFLVLEGIDGDIAYLNDPAQGRRRVSIGALGESFTGVVLAFEPGEAFRKSGRPPAALEIMLGLLRGSRPAVWLLLLISAALVVPGILIPTFTRVFVDEVLLRGSRGWLTPLLIGMAATAAARTMITLLQQSLLLRLQTKVAVASVSRFLWD